MYIHYNISRSADSTDDEIRHLFKNQTSFQAGQITHALSEWRTITSDPQVLKIVKGVEIEFAPGLSPQQHNVRASLFNQKQQAIVTKEIETLISKGVIVQSSHEPGEFISPIFIRPKPDDTYRMILNLRGFNEFVQYHHFKMDTLEAAVNLMKPGCFMASIDLKDAYYTVAISKAHQKYLKFIFNNNLYQYTCLPNGLSSAPRIFTKLLKPVYATLHNLGHLCLGYIDDSYLQGDTSAECHENVKTTASLFKRLGFHLHPDKSVTTPTQKLVFLGFILDSVNMTVRPTEGKIQKLITASQNILQKSSPTIEGVAAVIGLIVSNFSGAQYGPLHYRHLEWDKTQALQKNKGVYKSHMILSPSSKTELTWWIENMSSVKRDISHPNPSRVIQTDASKKGWGAVVANEETGGRWTAIEATNHINFLELLAAFFALKAFCSKMHDVHVQLQIDNTTAVSYINNMGGSKSPQLNTLATDMWHWCIDRNIWLSAVHIAGKLNTTADHNSRQFSDRHEWSLGTKYFEDISHSFPELEIDLFASRLNNKLEKYCSWKPDPGCTFVDAFTTDWSNLKFYAFPPFSLIQRCVQKIIKDKGDI